MLDLFPQPNRPRPPRYLTVFLSMTLGPDQPKRGRPEDVQVGDLVTFFDEDRAYRDRQVARVLPGAVVMDPLFPSDITRKVPFQDFYRVTRKVGG